MSLALAIVSCALAAGTCHATADPGTRSYAVRVTAPAGAVVRLRAADVPRGWTASFCTPRVCAPFTVALPVRGGTSAIQLSYVRTGEHPGDLHALHVAASSGGAHADARRAAVL
jgi:hypothetical protein